MSKATEALEQTKPKTRKFDPDTWKLSPSQLEKGACAARWGFAYLKGIKEPPSPYMEMGVVIHGLMETYYKTCVLPVGDAAGGVLLRALQHFPKATPERVGMTGSKPTLFVEVAFYNVPFAGGFHGGDIAGREMRADLVDTRRLDAEGVIELYDLKTTSSLDYAKSEEKLLDDIQPAVYCRALFLQHGAKLKRVECTWVYVERAAKGRTLPVPFTMTREVVATTERKWRERTEEIYEAVRTQPDPQQLTKNLDRCSDYRGCYYGPKRLNICEQSKSQQFRTLMAPPNKASSSAVAAALQQTKTNVKPPPAANAPKPPAAKPVPPKPVAPKKPPLPSPAVFDLPVQENGELYEESQRVDLLRFYIASLETDEPENPLAHLGAMEMPPADWWAAANKLVADFDAAQATQDAEASTADEPAEETVPELTEETSDEAADDATEGDATNSVEDTAPRGRGRPKGSANKPRGLSDDDVQRIANAVIAALGARFAS